MDERLPVKEGLLEDYIESTSSLRAMVQQMQHEKPGRQEEEGGTGTTTTGITTSILLGETMSAVQSSITTASASWLEQMAQAGNEYSEARQVTQLRHTQELLEQTGGNNKRFQVVQDFLVENSSGMVANVETSIEQVGRCQAEIQRFTRNAKDAQRTDDRQSKLRDNPAEGQPKNGAQNNG